MQVPLLSHLKNTNEIDIKLNRNHKWAPLGFKNNLLDFSSLATNLPRSDGAATKSTLTLLLLYWIRGGFLQD